MVKRKVDITGLQRLLQYSIYRLSSLKIFKVSYGEVERRKDIPNDNMTLTVK